MNWLRIHKGLFSEKYFLVALRNSLLEQKVTNKGKEDWPFLAPKGFEIKSTLHWKNSAEYIGQYRGQ